MLTKSGTWTSVQFHTPNTSLTRLIISETMSTAEFYGASPRFGGQGSTGSSALWIQCSGGNVPDQAVEAGHDSGVKLLVARARYQGALIPGKYHVGHRACYVSWGGEEHAAGSYEILMDPSRSLRWVPSSSGRTVPRSVIGGRTENAENLFVGRVSHNGTLTPGKVQPSHGTCYFPYGGKEFSSKTYEVLVG